MGIYFTTEDTEFTEDEEEKDKNLHALCVLRGEISIVILVPTYFLMITIQVYSKAVPVNRIYLIVLS